MKKTFTLIVSLSMLITLFPFSVNALEQGENTEYYNENDYYLTDENSQNDSKGSGNFKYESIQRKTRNESSDLFHEAEEQSSEQENSKYIDDGTNLSEQENSKSIDDGTNLSEQENSKSIDDGTNSSEQENSKSIDDGTDSSEQENSKSIDDGTDSSEQENSKSIDDGTNSSEQENSASLNEMEDTERRTNENETDEVVFVTNWVSFKEKFEDPKVSKIIIENDIDMTDEDENYIVLNRRSGPITIDGNNKTISGYAGRRRQNKSFKLNVYSDMKLSNLTLVNNKLSEESFIEISDNKANKIIFENVKINDFNSNIMDVDQEVDEFDIQVEGGTYDLNKSFAFLNSENINLKINKTQFNMIENNSILTIENIKNLVLDDVSIKFESGKAISVDKAKQIHLNKMNFHGNNNKISQILKLKTAEEVQIKDSNFKGANHSRLIEITGNVESFAMLNTSVTDIWNSEVVSAGQDSNIQRAVVDSVSIINQSRAINRNEMHIFNLNQVNELILDGKNENKIKSDNGNIIKAEIVGNINISNYEFDAWYKVVEINKVEREVDLNGIIANVGKGFIYLNNTEKINMSDLHVENYNTDTLINVGKADEFNLNNSRLNTKGKIIYVDSKNMNLTGNKFLNVNNATVLDLKIKSNIKLENNVFDNIKNSLLILISSNNQKNDKPEIIISNPYFKNMGTESNRFMEIVGANRVQLNDNGDEKKIFNYTNEFITIKNTNEVLVENVNFKSETGKNIFSIYSANKVSFINSNLELKSNSKMFYFEDVLNLRFDQNNFNNYNESLIQLNNINHEVSNINFERENILRAISTGAIFDFINSNGIYLLKGLDQSKLTIASATFFINGIEKTNSITLDSLNLELYLNEGNILKFEKGLDNLYVKDSKIEFKGNQHNYGLLDDHTKNSSIYIQNSSFSDSSRGTLRFIRGGDVIIKNGSEIDLKSSYRNKVGEGIDSLTIFNLKKDLDLTDNSKIKIDVASSSSNQTIFNLVNLNLMNYSEIFIMNKNRNNFLKSAITASNSISVSNSSRIEVESENYFDTSVLNILANTNHPTKEKGIFLNEGSIFRMKSPGKIIRMDSKNGGTFLIDGDGTIIDIQQIKSRNDYVLEFSGGNQKFLVKNRAVLNIQAADVEHSAVKMNGGNNEMIVTSGAHLDIIKKGPRKSSIWDSAKYSLFEFTGKGNNFIVENPQSYINLQASNGAIVKAPTNEWSAEIQVEISDKASFVARGNVDGSLATEWIRLGSGIFMAKEMSFKINNPSYVDLMNYSNKHSVINGIGSDSSVSITGGKTNLSIWKKGKNIEINPDFDWSSKSVGQFELKGKNLNQKNNLNDSKAAEIISNDGGLVSYSRILINNLNPIVENFNPIYNTDDYVAGKIVVPDSADLKEFRNAWPGEFQVKIREHDKVKRTTQDYTVETHDFLDNEIYEPHGPGYMKEEDLKGYFKVDLGKNACLSCEYEILEINKKYGNELTWESVPLSSDIRGVKLKVIDKKIPKPKISSNKIYENSRIISGEFSNEDFRAKEFYNISLRDNFGKEIASKENVAQNWTLSVPEGSLVVENDYWLVVSDHLGNETIHNESVIKNWHGYDYPEIKISVLPKKYEIHGKNKFIKKTDLPHMNRINLVDFFEIEGWDLSNSNSMKVIPSQKSNEVIFDQLDEGEHEFEFILLDGNEPKFREKFKLLISDHDHVEQTNSEVLFANNFYISKKVIDNRDMDKIEDTMKNEFIRKAQLSIYNVNTVELSNKDVNVHVINTNEDNIFNVVFSSTTQSIKVKMKVLDFEHVSETRNLLIVADDFSLYTYEFFNKEFFDKDIIIRSKARGYKKVYDSNNEMNHILEEKEVRVKYHDVETSKEGEYYADLIVKY